MQTLVYIKSKSTHLVRCAFSFPAASIAAAVVQHLAVQHQGCLWICLKLVGAFCSQTYIGIGMLVPKHITYAITLGAVLTWGEPKTLKPEP